MRRRSLAPVGVAALLIVGLVAQTAVALEPSNPGQATTGLTLHRSPAELGLRRLDAATLDRLRGLPGVGPASLKSNRTINVIVQLSAKPVSWFEGASLGQSGERLSTAERVSIAADISSQQDVVRQRIGALGGRIEASYRYALNGLRLSIGRNQLPALARLAGVAAVLPVPIFGHDLVSANKYVRSARAWALTDGLSRKLTGRGITIAIIDSGIDYFHADFGGPGTPAAYASDDPTVAGPSFPTAKVIAGYDLAGDDYDAGGLTGSATPTPDDDPRDCNGHGTHVAGIAAGLGVRKVGASASTYIGAYSARRLRSTNWIVPPGVAPRANLVALKVFGCAGTTSLVVDAIDRAVAMGGIDVINMSLGGAFARNDDVIALAVAGATSAGIVVVGSAGNEGPSAYVHGGVTTGDAGIAVAAVDALAKVPGAIVDLASQPDQPGINMNRATNLPLTANLSVLGGGSVPLDGCAAAQYTGTDWVGRIVVVLRGVCAFVDKGSLAQQAGAAAIIVINNVEYGPPPYLGPDPAEFTIPMIGLPDSSRSAVVASAGTAATLKGDGTMPSDSYRYLAYFTAGGPRNGDSALKPDISAPGVSVISAAAGLGTLGASFSGTSMSAPVIAGVAALTRQAHPTWAPLEIKSALMGTSDAGKKKLRPFQYDPRLAGAGVVDAFRAADTVAFIQAGDPGGASLSFGYDELAGAYSEQRTFTLVNRGSQPITYRLSRQFIGGDWGATLTFSREQVTVQPGAAEVVTVTLALSAGAVAELLEAFAGEAIADNAPSAPFTVYQVVNDIFGVIEARPTARGHHRQTLRLPFLWVPRGVSDVTLTSSTGYTTNGDTASFTATLANSSSLGHHAGMVDLYAWGLQDSSDAWAGSDLRAVGVQQYVCDVDYDCAADDRLIVFAANTWGRWTSLSTEEFDILIDLNLDGLADYAVFNGDYGWLLGGTFDGTQIVLTCKLNPDGTCDALSLNGFFPEGQPLNGSTTLLPTLGSWLGMSSASGRFQYGAAALNVLPSGYGLSDVITTENGVDAAWAPWHPWQPAVSSGDFYELGLGATVSQEFAVSLANIGQHGSPRGWMIVTQDDRSGERQADLIPLGTLP